MPSTSPKTPRCQICGKAIKNKESLALGIGPECLAKRESFLAAAGSSVKEIEVLSASGDASVQKYLRCAYGAIGEGRKDRLASFLFAARKAVA